MTSSAHFWTSEHAGKSPGHRMPEWSYAKKLLILQNRLDMVGRET